MFLLGDLIIAVEAYSNKDTKDAEGRVAAWEIARLELHIDRRFGGLDCKRPKVYLQKGDENLPMVDPKSGKHFKELELIDLLKEVEFGYTRFDTEMKLILRGMLREFKDHGSSRVHLLWSESHTSDEEKQPERLSFEDFKARYMENHDEFYISSDKWFTHIQREISPYDAKYISNIISGWPNEAAQKFAYEIYIQAL